MIFALFFGNRGFFPGELIESARKEVADAVKNSGHDYIELPVELTRYGAVESVSEGEIYAKFLKENEGDYDGVIMSLPNFSDETGAIAALQDCGTPILIQAYPDEFGKMDFMHRRDSFCGKFSIMDVFYQYQLPFTTYIPHVVHPNSDTFSEQIDQFARVCNVVKGMRRFTVGAIGARTTAFKTVRFDELALQKTGITVETIDLSDVFARMKDVNEESETFINKIDRLKKYSDWSCVPKGKMQIHAKLGVVLDDLIKEYKMDCVAIRCWDEFEKHAGISPCVLLSEMNDRGIVSACELDVCNAIPMYALSLASGDSSACLDWNNNYGDEKDKCILFHCGPVAKSLMVPDSGHITEHPMFKKAYGEGCGWGTNEGRIAANSITLVSSKTENGSLVFYITEGEFTEDIIEQGYFGCAGVVRIDELEKKLLTIGKQGFRHHVGVGIGQVASVLREAFKYLNYSIIDWEL